MIVDKSKVESWAKDQGWLLININEETGSLVYLTPAGRKVVVELTKDGSIFQIVTNPFYSSV